ncbi:hypothetical protein BUALT_Bualt13G0092500 [Buddleja alternifolia]|uniref:RRM domain-containing protein n=1 Tax=Buddleja alternifolia TaxID=168488 RepID=A0AAV6WN27_9LAMI|nr:hypothetical protein BUALT_Bualt13G0092500 [Buddleja alternifolia]
MESVFGLVGKDFAIVVADSSVVHSILVHKTNEDKIMLLDSHKLMGASGETAAANYTRGAGHSLAKGNNLPSRICVKNLPKYVTNDRLIEFFSQKGEVTDSIVIRTRDGKNRQFGFVGFRTEHEAEEAINYFNNSLFDTCRITCEIAWEVGDPNIPRPWSRYSLKKHTNSSEEEKRARDSKGLKAALTGHESKKRKKDDMDCEPQLEEFLQVMQPRSRSKLWANDTAPSLERSRVPLNNKLPLADKHEERFDGQDALPEGIKGERVLSSAKQEEDEPNIVVNDDDVSNLDYLRRRIKKEWSDSVGNAHNKISADPSSWENKNEQFLESGRLFVLNLPYTATEEELGDHFSKYGSISQVHIVVDKDTKRSKGFAYVSFALPKSAARALEETNGSIFQGRLLRVMPAEQKNLSDKQKINNSGNNHSKTFKQQRNAEKKASEASGNSRAWNSLFMRQDIVVEHIARKFCVSKGELLSDDPAVKVALAETQVIAETKKALSNAGVNIASLEQFAAGKTDGVKRSDRVILVKNLTYGSFESELSTIFGRFGSLDKIILPPTKTLALVIFLEPAEARAAFDVLRYKRYK